MGWLAFAPVVDKFTRNREYQTIPDLPENILSDPMTEFDPEFAYMSGVTRDEWSEYVCELCSIRFNSKSNPKPLSNSRR